MGSRPKATPTFVTEDAEYFVPEVKPERVWSKQQEDIFSWFALTDGKHAHMMNDYEAPNLVVRARAGTGKTTTILEGVKRAPEDFILLTSFGRRIVNEMKTRNESGADVQTLHALGNTYIRRNWKGIRVVGDGRARQDWLTDQAVGIDVPRQIRNLISKLHTKGREMEPLTFTVDSLLDLAWRFDLVPDESWNEFNGPFVARGAHAAMTLAKKQIPTQQVGIDFADMIFLPLAHNLVAKDYELVVVDEAQDMTVSQLELAVRSCSGRICIVGDDRQAIYGFRGADSGALDRLKVELKAVELPLNVTYRCPQTVVAKAKVLVPDFVGASDRQGVVEQRAPGEVFTWGSGSKKTDHPGPHPGDFVLSRLNAPLVSVCLGLLRAGIPAFMAGRDIGKNLDDIIRKFKMSAVTPIEKLLEQLMRWEDKEIQKAAVNGRDDLIPAIQDRADTIRAFAENCNTVGNLIQHCQKVLVSEEDLPGGQYVLCSSVHKAKGLEADTVFFLVDTLYRRGRNQEEENIEYVGITRAKNRLVLVSNEFEENDYEDE